MMFQYFAQFFQKYFHSNIKLYLATLTWLLLLGISICILVDYENKPELSTNAPQLWPMNSHLYRVPGKYTLIMSLHPHCACSRASIQELNLILARVQHTPLSTYLLFYQSSKFDSSWKETLLWKKTHQLKHVIILEDINGKIAKKFKAATSGQTVLYSPTGKLLFNGGITPARGHEGDNAGREAIIALLSQKSVPRHTSFVFGCPLFTLTVPGKNHV